MMTKPIDMCGKCRFYSKNKSCSYHPRNVDDTDVSCIFHKFKSPSVKNVEINKTICPFQLEINGITEYCICTKEQYQECREAI